MGQFCSTANAEYATNYLYVACGGLDPGGSLSSMEVCEFIEWTPNETSVINENS